MEAPSFTGRADRRGLATLRQATFAPRPRAVLEAMLGLTSSVLEAGLDQTFNEYEQHLFKQAEQAHGGEAQDRCFQTLREIRKERADIAPRFMLRLESALARLGQSEQAPAFARERRRKPEELSLVATGELEESLSLQEVAARAEVRHGQALFALGQRLGVIAGSPALEVDELPVGPHWLCECMRYAMSGIEIGQEQRVELFRMFERHCMAPLGPLLEQLNELCVRQRVLPHLQFHGRVRKIETVASSAAYLHGTPQRERSGGGGAPGSRERPRTLSLADENTSDAPVGLGLGTMQPTRTGDRAIVRPAEESVTPPAFELEPMQAQAEIPAPSPAPSLAPPQDVFETLRRQLAARRRALGVADAQAGAADHPARSEDVQGVLGALQHRPAPPMLVGGKLLPRSIAHLKQDVLNQLRQLTPAGQQPRLGERDSDTMDLLGMLFEHLVRENSLGTTAHELLTRLQVPLLRLALKDKGFFERRVHPARQLLNAVAEAAVHWVDDGGEDRIAVDKLRLMVDRMSQEYDERPGWFEELLADLARHMTMLARKSDVSERRHVDAAKGRERLELARRAAAQAVATRVQRFRPSVLIRTLLELAWTDVLAITILRQGEESESYARRLAVADRLVHQGGITANLADDVDASALRHELESGLVQVGYHADDVALILGRLFERQAATASDDPVSLTELALKLKARSRLGEDAETEGGHAPPPDAPPPTPLTEAEAVQLERLRALPLGTWFDFGGVQHGERVRRKLSWYSNVTGRCLLVNQRGARSDDTSLEQLARDLARGKVQILQTHRESVVERAWNGVLSDLRPYADAEGGGAGP